MDIAQVSTATIFPNFSGSLNFSEIERIQSRSIVPSRFVNIGHKWHKAAKYIDTSWDQLSSDQKETLRKLAYGLIDPSKKTSGILPEIWASIYLLFIKLTGQEKSFLFCLDALDCLVDSILNAIENEKISSSNILSDTLQELTSSTEFGESVNERDRRR